MLKKTTLLWREAHFQVKMYKTHQGRSTFGSWDVEKVHAIVARSTFPSQNVQSTPRSAHFWKLRCSKRVRRCGAKHISKSKCTKHLSLGTLLEAQMSKKCTPLWREAHFEVRILKKKRMSRHFWTLKRLFVWQAQGILHPAKSEQNVRVLWHIQNDGRRGTLEEDLQRCISRATRSTRDMFIRDVERGCILEHQVFRFAKMILRDRCSTSHDPWQAQYFKQTKWKDRFEARLAELLRFWCCQLEKLRKSRRIASVLTLSSSKIEEASQNCCASDLSSSKTEEVSQNSFVFKLVDRQIDK